MNLNHIKFDRSSSDLTKALENLPDCFRKDFDKSPKARIDMGQGGIPIIEIIPTEERERAILPPEGSTSYMTILEKKHFTVFSYRGWSYRVYHQPQKET